jgi:hypothetical protein
LRRRFFRAAENGVIDLSVDLILQKLTSVVKRSNGWSARCPAHDDQQQSLSISIKDGKILLHCFAGCKTEDVLAAVGLTWKDLFSDNGRKEGDVNPPCNPRNRATALSGGITLTEYATAKRLPEDFLLDLGVAEVKRKGQRALEMPYLDTAGQVVAVRYRVSLSGDLRFVWRRGDKAKQNGLYGLWRLSKMRRRGFLILVEGESDTQTLWYHDFPALGIAGADNWNEEWAASLADFPTIYVVIEPDTGGDAMMRWLSTSAIRDRARLVRLDVKDPSSLYLRDRENFKVNLQAALNAATAWTDFQQNAEADQKSATFDACADLAQCGGILDRLVSALRACGVAGEERAAKLLYLVVTSRLLKRPVPGVVKGTSSAGKSFLAQSVLDFFPEEAYYTLSAMSERALAYTEEPLKHRFLVLFEAAGLTSNFASYIVRSLISEGRVRYETVDKTAEGLRPRLIVREGPTGFLTTTTRLSLHPENETRLLSIPVNDTPEQTRNVLIAQAEEKRELPDFQEWHALQQWLAQAEHTVTIPFGRALAELIPPVAVRLRRDFPTVLSLIRAHVILHQLNRSCDDKGRIIATIDDYKAVHELVADLIAQGAGTAVPKTVRETVEAVKAIMESDVQSRQSGVTKARVGKHLKLDKSAATRRVDAALALGYLVNVEERKNQPAKLVMGEPLPEEQPVLPTPEDLAEAVARLHGCNGCKGDTSAPSSPSDSDDDPFAELEKEEVNHDCRSD